MQEQQPPQYDTIYQTFDKGLYKRTGSDSTNAIMNMISADPGANNSTMVNVPSDLIGSGQGTSATSMAVGGVMSGKVNFTDTTEGYFLGVDADGTAKLNIGDGTSFIQWDGTNVSMFLGAGGTLTIDTGSSFTGSSISLSEIGLKFLFNGIEQALFYLGFGTSPYTVAYVDLEVGQLPAPFNGVIFRFRQTGDFAATFEPGGGYTLDLGNASHFWNEINYKTLTDRGCLGWFDQGVEMQDGRVLSDIEAMKAVKINTKRQTVYGVPMLDYTTMPKAVYKPAPIATEDVYEKGELRFKKGEKMGQDGAETTALISIMFGAIKELAARVEALEGKGPKSPPPGQGAA